MFSDIVLSLFMSDLELGKELPLYSIVPFALLLLAIAVLPLAVPHWWERNRNKAIISSICALPILLFLIANDYHLLVHTATEYFSFIILLASLFIISGGIHLKGAFAGTPLVNTAFLFVGAILASFIGTTGASMLLIRPLIKANEKRCHKAHIVVFFIFIVSNIGGCLTPLGDPPLFLGFLRGVRFEWTLILLPQWMFVTSVLLVIFNLLDQYWFNKEELATHEPLVEEVQPKRMMRIYGKMNFLFLFGVLVAIFLSGHFKAPYGVQEGAMIFMTILSLWLTPREYRKAHDFDFAPIVEVAVLFAGIFVTMVPALLILNARGGELGVEKPWQFFWATGALSGFLDNAPTYLTFTALASGLVKTDASHLNLLADDPFGGSLLIAISCGAVFMGANTYIGNGPNFMVKSIAEKSGIKMPSFFGYMLWSVVILIPIFIITTLLFFL